jgi:hypothetical protein
MLAIIATMQYSDTSSSKNGLIQECEFKIFGEDGYGRISGNPNLLATFTRNINIALNRVTALILMSDGRWQWDDTNRTDFPIGITDLVTTIGSEQQDYSLDVNHLEILRVEVKDSNGGWHKLIPMDQADLPADSLTDFLKTAGFPQYYDKTANSIFLYPKPLGTSVTPTGGLKVYYQRPPGYFAVDDTTKVPGFNSLYHPLVAHIACRDYALSKPLSIANGLVSLVGQEEEALQEDYSMRSKDERIGFSARRLTTFR